MFFASLTRTVCLRSSTQCLCLLVSLDQGSHFSFLMIISGTTLRPSPWLPWQPHQCAILADCQSVGMDYSDIIPQHLAQSAEFSSHEIAPFHLRASDLNRGRQQARRESKAATLRSGFSTKPRERFSQGLSLPDMFWSPVSITSDSACHHAFGVSA